MIEINFCYDLLPGMDQQAYGEWVKKAVGATLRSPGIIEFRASRNVLGSPEVRGTSVWKSLADWAKFMESDEWQAIRSESYAFITNVRSEIWGPSPLVPESLRPGS